MQKLVNGELVEMTSEEISNREAEVVKWEASQQATEYARKRTEEYPSLADQIGAILKGGTELAELKATVIAIKEKYPKPTKD